MSYLCAVTGKGGVGKTTLSALLIRQLIQNGMEPVLAVDADPNSCLDAALGVSATHTVGRAREEVREAAAAIQGVSKQELLQLKIAESLVESSGFDLIAMGRPEGAGCYCYANNVLKSVLGEIAGSYPYVVLDNEAGLENLSRRLVSRVDMLILVSDASNAGLRTLERLHALAAEMGTAYGTLALVVNRLRGEMPEAARRLAKTLNAGLLAGLPDDAALAELAENGGDLLRLPDSSPVMGPIQEIIRHMK